MGFTLPSLTRAGRVSVPRREYESLARFRDRVEQIVDPDSIYGLMCADAELVDRVRIAVNDQEQGESS